MQSAVEDDFQRAIMEDGTPNEKLKTDLNKVHAEREQVQKMLGNMDNLLRKALEGIRSEVEADREKIFKNNARTRSYDDEVKGCEASLFEVTC